MPSDAKKKRDQAKKLAAKQGKTTKGKPVQNEEENGQDEPKTTNSNGSVATENGDSEEVSQEGNCRNNMQFLYVWFVWCMFNK